MVVVDASVAFKWFDEEIWSLQAIKLLENHLNIKETIYVPELVFYELMNAWSTKSALDQKRILFNLEVLEEYSLKIIPLTFALIKKIIIFSKKYRVSAYDASYAVLAQDRGCNLYTADDRFVEKVNLPFIKSLGSI